MSSSYWHTLTPKQSYSNSSTWQWSNMQRKTYTTQTTGAIIQWFTLHKCDNYILYCYIWRLEFMALDASSLMLMPYSLHTLICALMTSLVTSTCPISSCVLENWTAVLYNSRALSTFPLKQQSWHFGDSTALHASWQYGLIWGRDY